LFEKGRGEEKCRGKKDQRQEGEKANGMIERTSGPKNKRGLVERMEEHRCLSLEARQNKEKTTWQMKGVKLSKLSLKRRRWNSGSS